MTALILTLIGCTGMICGSISRDGPVVAIGVLTAASGLLLSLPVP